MRQIFLIEKDLQEYQRLLSEAINKRNFVRVTMLTEKVSELQNELEEAKETIVFHKQSEEMDKNLRNWAGKTLSLSLNEADLALYHLDMFFAYFKDRGYVEKTEWASVFNKLKKSLKEFREFSAYFFNGQNAKNNLEDSCILSNLIREKVFTDRELVYYDLYEEKASNL